MTHSRIVFTLPDGTLHAHAQLLFETAMDKKRQPSGKNAMAVIGGTGAYLKSRGEIIATFAPGRPSRYEFKLHCG